jgi:hypothetical protein
VIRIIEPGGVGRNRVQRLECGVQIEVVLRARPRARRAVRHASSETLIRSRVLAKRREVLRDVERDVEVILHTRSRIQRAQRDHRPCVVAGIDRLLLDLVKRAVASTQ